MLMQLIIGNYLCKVSQKICLYILQNYSLKSVLQCLIIRGTFIMQDDFDFAYTHLEQWFSYFIFWILNATFRFNIWLKPYVLLDLGGRYILK